MEVEFNLINWETHQNVFSKHKLFINFLISILFSDYFDGALYAADGFVFAEEG